MSDDQIKWVVTADDKDIIAAFNKMNKAQQKLIEDQRKLAAESKKSADAQLGGLKSVTGELRDMASQWVSIGAVVGVVTGAYRNFRSETEKLGQAHQKLSQDITRALSRAGDLARGKEIEGALGSMKGATREQATAAFSGISDAAPGLPLAQRLALTGQVAKQAPTGADLNQLGNITAKMAQLMPGKSADDVMDIVAMMRQRTGEDFARMGGDEFEASMGKAIAAGMAPEKAMALGMAGVEANLPSKSINSILGSLVETDPNAGKPRHGPMSKEDRLKAKFYKLSPDERFAALSRDPATAQAMLGAGGDLNMRVIGDTKSQQEAMRQAQAGNFATNQLGQLGGFTAGREALLNQETAVRKDQATRARAMQEAQFQRAAEFSRSINADRGALSQARIETEIMGVGFGARGGNVGNFNNQAPADSLLQGMQQMGFMTEQQANHFRQQEKQNSEIIAELKKLNNRPAAKNINQHAEN